MDSCNLVLVIHPSSFGRNDFYYFLQFKKELEDANMYQVSFVQLCKYD